MHLKLWNYWICIIYYIYNMIKNPDANQSQILLIPGSHRWPLQYVYRSQLYQFRTPTPQIWVTTGGNATSLHNRINDGWGTSEKRPKIGGNCQLNKFYPVIKHTLMDMIDNCRMKKNIHLWWMSHRRDRLCVFFSNALHFIDRYGKPTKHVEAFPYRKSLVVHIHVK